MTMEAPTCRMPWKDLYTYDEQPNIYTYIFFLQICIFYLLINWTSFFCLNIIDFFFISKGTWYADTREWCIGMLVRYCISLHLSAINMTLKFSHCNRKIYWAENVFHSFFQLSFFPQNQSGYYSSLYRILL